MGTWLVTNHAVQPGEEMVKAGTSRPSRVREQYTREWMDDRASQQLLIMHGFKRALIRDAY